MVQTDVCTGTVTPCKLGHHYLMLQVAEISDRGINATLRLLIQLNVDLLTVDQ